MNCTVTNQSIEDVHLVSAKDLEHPDEFLLGELYQAFETIRSYAVSGREAADRGDRDEIRLRLRVQLRDTFRHAVKLHDLLSTERASA